MRRRWQSASPRFDALAAALDSEVRQRRAVCEAPAVIDWTVEAAVVAERGIAAGTHVNERRRRAAVARPPRCTARERARQAELEERRRAEGRCLSCGRALKRVPGRSGRPPLRCNHCRAAA